MNFVQFEFSKKMPADTRIPLSVMLFNATKRLFDQNPIVGMSWVMAGLAIGVTFVAPPVR